MGGYGRGNCDDTEDACADTEQLHIPGHRLPVKDFFYEPFRWNQTLNTIDMVPEGEKVNPKIREMSDAMGGGYRTFQSIIARVVFYLTAVLRHIYARKLFE